MLRVKTAGAFLWAVVAACSGWAIMDGQAAEHQLAGKASGPKIAAASDEGELAIKRFVPQPGFKVDLFAAEPHLANPVSFYIDNRNKFYVVETFRLHAGVMDIRGIMNWLDEDLACRTVDDRLAEMKRHLGTSFSESATESERIQLVEDRDGDGKADHSNVFAENFNDPLDGIAAGIVARKNDVWFTDIPNLWHLRDKNGDGVADERRSLHYGFGVRVGFLGHDLHGLCFGPDGKLYFSIGDRGTSVKVGDKIIGHPDCGSVFRCNPDGSELEEFAFGLRNPQELAFDQYGNLFTGDNNSDGGDKARWVYVVEGGDSGWRNGYQFLGAPLTRGPWNAEKLWYPQWDGQAAYLVPPVANIADGPSGNAFYPGTGMPDSYKNHFFLTDFHGGKGSGIFSFALQPNGASFELVDKQKFIWETLPTDVDFGIDGGIYFTDWVQGWEMTGKGRIYHVYQPDAIKQPIVAETKALLFEGMEKRSLRELGKLLGHANQRVRQEAQFELADRGQDAVKTLAGVAKRDANQLARVHAIWGLGQIAAKIKTPGRKEGILAVLEPVLPLLDDGDPEIRAQAARVLGDHHSLAAYDGFIKLLTDASPRNRYFAAIGLAKLGRREALPALLAMIRDNAGKDRVLRHAGVMGLVGINDIEGVLANAKDPSPAVRMAVLLTLRRLERTEIEMFLKDKDPALVIEAARAISDVPISGAMPELAALLDGAPEGEWLVRRAINANLRFNTDASAAALARYASRAEAPDILRAEAISALSDWPKASGRDRITGMWRPIASARDAAAPANALRPAIGNLIASGPDSVRSAAAKAAEELQLTEGLPALRALARDGQANSRTRVSALRALAGLNDDELSSLLNSLSSDSSDTVRSEAVKLSAKLKPSGVVDKLNAALANGTQDEKQSAFATLGGLADSGADTILASWLDKLLAGQVPDTLKLDLVEAAGKRNDSSVKEKLAKYEASRPKDDTLGVFRDVLAGGNAEAGKKIFTERAEVSCIRCHKAGGEGGEVGPNLTGVGTRHNREYILESIVYPNRQIAAGFETLLVTLNNGTAYAGIMKSENDKEMIINSPEDGIVTIKKGDIKSRQRGLSGMPEGMGNILNKFELRDVVEFLSTVK